MPKRNDISKILIIGSGPIIIGQACEFDYSGTQACKALKKLGYDIVLVNSNPATIMTDPDIADVTYIEPLNEKRLEQIIEKERPDALLPNLGGQSALNLSMELQKKGILEKFHVELLGVHIDAIERGEDRIEFKKTLQKLGIGMAKSEACYSLEEAKEAAKKLGYPCVVRPAFTMGGTGGGLVYNVEELEEVAKRGLEASIIHQVLIEESILGWEELELEIVRDAKNQMITVCFIENVDPLGVHTGDSICTAPMLTIPEDVQKELQRQAYSIVEEVQVIGGTNVQFARNPEDGRIVVIEINPRTSRSSALASKATGFPIALVSAMLAAGLTLDEIPSGKFGTLDKYVPGGDYVVVKFPRWTFEKFKQADPTLGTQMKAVGEVMAIGKNYKEALQKAVRSLEIGRFGFGFAKNFHEMTKEQLLIELRTPTAERMFQMYEAFRKGATIEEVAKITYFKPFFLKALKELVELEEELLQYKGQIPPADLLARAKRDGFGDYYLQKLLGVDETKIRAFREEHGIHQVWHKIDAIASEDAGYYYSTYLDDQDAKIESNRKKIMILGGGPNRIGQGIEFDYCCVHAAFTLRKLGFETIMVNCNPETVSTDYDTTDRLYFEPLTLEDVMGIYHKEKPEGVIAQFGGQTPLNLAARLEREGVHILGTSPQTINIAEDRDQFRAMMERLSIPMPESGVASNKEEALAVARRIGYPVMVRPSFVLGGRGMEIIHEEKDLDEYMDQAENVSAKRPVLIDRFLHHATECEADAIADKDAVFIPAVMEHIEWAGVHSGDSACILPSLNISKENLKTIEDYTKKIARELGVRGLMNMQYAIEDDVVYLLEANPRASRTVPLVSKVCSINMVDLATKIITSDLTGEPSPVKGLKRPHIRYCGVKEAVFPFNMFHGVDPILGPEMRSTGEVLGLGDTFGEAYFKAQEETQQPLPLEGKVLLSVNDADKQYLEGMGRAFIELGFEILATDGTYQFLKEHGIPATKIYKIREGRPNIEDAIKNHEIQLIINTPSGKGSHLDGRIIRTQSVRTKATYTTTIAAGLAMIQGIREVKAKKGLGVKSLQAFHQDIEN